MGKAFGRIFSVIDVLLLFSAVGVLIYDIVVLAQFTEEIVGPIAGFVIFSITIQAMTLIAIAVGLRAFFIKSQMWIITSNALLCAAMCFTIIGATFFTVLAGQTNDNEDGFRRIVSDIELNFNIQVFNDCCNPAVAEESVGFSLGDIVSQDLCDTLIDNEGESFVGADINSCGDDGAGNLIFNDFQQDFENFTDDFYFVVQGILWTQATLMLASFILNCSLTTCAPPGEEDKGDQVPEVDMTGLENFPVVPQKPDPNRLPSMAPPPAGQTQPAFGAPPLPPNKPTPLIPYNVRNNVRTFVGGLSAKFGRNSAEGDGTNGPPAGGFFGRFSANMPRPPRMPKFGGGSGKNAIFNPPGRNSPAPNPGPGGFAPVPSPPVVMPGQHSPGGSFVSENDKAELWKSL